MAAALAVPLSYLYCEDDQIAELLLRLERLAPEIRLAVVERCIQELA